jgi:hypothetical protein
MKIDFEITYRGETVNLDETASQMVVSFTLYDGNFPNGGSGGAVDSVNGKTGTVVLNADDIAETSTRKWLTATLNGYYDSAYAWVNTNGASVLQSISDLTTALGNKVDKVTGYGLSKNDFTDALKNAYDGAVTNATNAVNWISSNGTNLLNHLVNTSNPHNTTASQVGAYTTSQVDTALGLKANVTEVETILFKTITPTVVTGKTVETCIYSIPLPVDGLNYIIEVSSKAQITLYGGSAISHRLRVGTYLSPIDGASGADAIGNQTVLGFKSESTGVGFPVTRRFKYFGGSTGSIFGMQASIGINDDNVSNSTSITLKSADLTTQHYLYVSFNPSIASGAIVTHLMLTIKVIKI